MRKTIRTAFTVAFAVVAIAMGAQHSLAQTQPITFTQPGGPSGTSSLTFPFNFNGVGSFSIDQLGSVSFDLNSDDLFGPAVFLGLSPASPVFSFGLVQPGDTIDPNDPTTTSTFVSAPNGLDLLAEAQAGNDINVGFLSSSQLAGFFEVSFDDLDGGAFDGSLTFSEGQISIEPSFALTVPVPSAIPEPSTAVLLGLMGSVVALRRRR